MKRSARDDESLVALPAGVLLQLCRERDDHGRQWILVDAIPLAGVPSPQPQPHPQT